MVTFISVLVGKRQVKNRIYFKLTLYTVSRVSLEVFTHLAETEDALPSPLDS